MDTPLSAADYAVGLVGISRVEFPPLTVWTSRSSGSNSTDFQLKCVEGLRRLPKSADEAPGSRWYWASPFALDCERQRQHHGTYLQARANHRTDTCSRFGGGAFYCG